MRITPRSLLLIPAALLLAACADPTTGPSAPLTAPRANVVGEPGFVLLKKFGPNATYTFDLDIAYGVFTSGNPATVNNAEWTELWRANDPAAPIANMDVFEQLTPGLKVDSVWIMPLVRMPDGTLLETINYQQTIVGTNQFTIPDLGWNNAAYVQVFNSAGQGAEGCTPGYWKQPHHFDSWTGYAPTAAFSSVFANAFPGKSLVQVAGQGGGGLKALGRHTVAALLNSTSAGVDYPLSTAEVIALFNAAYASGNYEAAKNRLAGLNERNCYLN
jgi:hypothetical protein